MSSGCLLLKLQENNLCPRFYNLKIKSIIKKILNLTVMNKIQKSVEEWVSQPQHKVKYFPPFEMCAQLQEEVGEIAREISHLHGYKKKKDGEKTDGLECEIGDTLFALACLANYHEIDLDKAFNKSMEKKNSRDKNRFT